VDDILAEKTCKFCKIARKELSSSRIYEDEDVMAFLDIRPLNEGHTLVIPKKHYETIYNAPDEEIGHLFKIVKKVACAVKKSVGAEGITISQHNERAAGQDIFHVHVHVLPRYEGQKLPRREEALTLPEASREKLDEVARKIKLHI
jgi:histidine triad (HIT) family protein